MQLVFRARLPRVDVETETEKRGVSFVCVCVCVSCSSSTRMRGRPSAGSTPNLSIRILCAHTATIPSLLTASSVTLPAIHDCTASPLRFHKRIILSCAAEMKCSPSRSQAHALTPSPCPRKVTYKRIKL